jgi:HEAT repeat protein
MLDDRDAGIRREAAGGLGRLGGEKAVAALRGKLDDPVAEIRVSAAAALAHLGDALGAASLAQFLRDRSPEVRRPAVGAYAYRKAGLAQDLLSRDCDGTPPWLDPQERVTEARVTQASRYLEISKEEVRSRYEALATDLGLKLGWKEGPPAADHGR